MELVAERSAAARSAGAPAYRGRNPDWNSRHLLSGSRDARARRRVVLDRPTLHWLNEALAEPGVELLDLTPAVAVKAAELADDLPGDPADRLIVASAILQSALLVTRDARLQKFAGVRTIWT